MFANLPPPLPGKRSWPWDMVDRPRTTDENSLSAVDRQSPNASWPKLSIVTPSFNQGQFIEETIRSILLQGYPNLEYIIVDGGSTDQTIDIIKKYEPWITYWVSEPDGGMYDAINKGFSLSTGDIMAWSNTDDVYLPGALQTVGRVFRKFPEIDWLTSLWKVQWNEDGQEINRYKVQGFNRQAFYRGRNLLGSNRYATFMIQQQSTFWTRALWDRSGGRVNDKLALAGDFELWTRFYQHAELYALDQPIGVFRFQPNQKTATQSREYLREAEEAFKLNGGRYPSTIEGWFRTRLIGRIPPGYLQYIPCVAYTARVIQRRADGEWGIQKRWFA